MILAFNLWDGIISVLAFLFALGLIIIIHEGGHFFFARRANILCREYAFGMGPLLWKKKKGETLYSIRALPIGGFCAIAGEELEEDPLKELKNIKLFLENGIVKKLILDDKNNLFDDIKEVEIVEYDLYDADDTGKLFVKVIDNGQEIEYPVDPQALYVFIKPVRNNAISKEKQIERYSQEFQIAPHNRTLGAKNKRQRAMVMFGGPLMNFVLAIFMFFFASLILGFADTSSTKIGEVSTGTPAYSAGLQEGDVILELSSGDLTAKLKEWNSISNFMEEYRNNKTTTDTVVVKYMRGSEELTTTIKPMVVIYSISMIQDITSNEVKIGEVDSKSLAYAGGLRTGDIIKNIKYPVFSDFALEQLGLSSQKLLLKLVSENENSLNNEYSEKQLAQYLNISNEKINLISNNLGQKNKFLLKDVVSLLIEYKNEQINSWKDVYNIFTENEVGYNISLNVLREYKENNVTKVKEIECSVDPYSKQLFDDTQNVGITAILMGISPTTKLNFGKSLIYPFTEFWASLKNMVLTLKHLFTGSVGINNLSGPVGIFTLTSQAASEGFGTLLNFIGFLSVNVGFMNLLPIPALDGGRLLFLGYEAITKKKPSQKVETALISITMILLLALIAYVSFNDILRIFK